MVWKLLNVTEFVTERGFFFYAAYAQYGNSPHVFTLCWQGAKSPTEMYLCPGKTTEEVILSYASMLDTDDYPFV